MPIVKGEATSEEIYFRLRELPLGPLRQMLPDAAILDACRRADHTFRRRQYDPVVTVLHYLAQAIQREKSFAATWHELWVPLAADLPDVASAPPDDSGLTHARGRLPVAVMQALADQALRETPDLASRWGGLRLVALDGSTVSMPREPELVEHFGLHRLRQGKARYPLARFCSLLAVGTSTLLGYRFGLFGTPETTMALPLLETLGPDDLTLADRYFAGSPTLARFTAAGRHFLMRKNARLIPEHLPVVQRLGKDDFLTDLAVSPSARKADPTLPKTVRVRLFRATWKAPTGETITEWFVTSLVDAKRFKRKALARLYHERWRIETSYLEFKQTFHADVLRSKTVANIEKEFAAHVLAYQLVRRLMVAAAQKHAVAPTRLSFLNAARATVRFSQHMAAAPASVLPIYYDRLLEAIAASTIDVRPGRIEPRALAREWKHYPHLRLTRSEWRRQRLRGVT